MSTGHESPEMVDDESSMAQSSHKGNQSGNNSKRKGQVSDNDSMMSYGSKNDPAK